MSDPLKESREDLMALVGRQYGMRMIEGRPKGNRGKHKYICACIARRWVPLALILENCETTKHAYVELDDEHQGN